MRDYLGPYELNQIYTGDARELAQAIPDESVDLVFTDPLYDRIDDYRWLAETAARVLKPDSACLVWIATMHLGDVLRIMCPLLSYIWVLNWQRYGSCYPGKPGINVINQCLWFGKGNSKTRHMIADWIGSGFDLANRINTHKWSKPEPVLYKWTEAFTHPDAIVFDPFTGGGTVPAVCKMLGRNYLAFEIDPQTADLARQRVAMTQPPLFVVQPEQLSMEITSEVGQ